MSRGELEGALQEFAPQLRVLDRGLILRSGARSDGYETPSGFGPDFGVDADDDGGSGTSHAHEFPANPAPVAGCDARDGGMGDLIIDWVAVDPTGRLNLVIWLGSDREALPAEPVDIAFEILQRVKEQMPFILRHLGAKGVQARIEPRLVAVATHFLEGTVRKLSVLGPERIRLLEVHAMESESGETYHMVQRWPFETEETAPSPERFLDGLQGDLRLVAERVLESLQHVDERVVVLGAGNELLEWTLLNQTLCRLEQGQAGLQGRIGGEGESTHIDDESANVFLEAVLRRYFEMLSADPEKDESDSKTSIVDQGLGVVLSSEEMDAFR